MERKKYFQGINFRITRIV